MYNPINMIQQIQYMMSEYNKFKNNPIQWLTSNNISNPQEMLQNPQAGFQNMMNNGMINNEGFNQRLNKAISLAQSMQGQGLFK